MEVFKGCCLKHQIWLILRFFSPLPDTTTLWMRLWFSGSIKVVSEGDYCNTGHVIGFQNHPEVSWFLTGLLRSHGAAIAQKTKPWNIHMSDSELSINRKTGCLLSGLAITNKQNPKRRCLQLHAAVAHRDLSKCGNWPNPAACIHSNNCICVNLIPFLLDLAKKCIQKKNLQCENEKQENSRPTIFMASHDC